MANRQTRWTGIAAAVVLALIVVYLLVAWITRGSGCVDPYDANLSETVRVFEGPDGECYYDYIGN